MHMDRTGNLGSSVSAMRGAVSPSGRGKRRRSPWTRARSRRPSPAEGQAAAGRMDRTTPASRRGGSVWPVADDITLEPVDVDGVAGEWSIAPGSDASRILMFFHGGGYCSGSILSHRRLVTEAGRAAGVRTLALAYRLAPEHPFPAALEDALTAWHFLRTAGHRGEAHRGRRRQCGGRPDAGPDRSASGDRARSFPPVRGCCRPGRT